MKHVIRITMMLLLVPMVASAQWEFAGVFPDSTRFTANHGLAVDAEGKVWVAPYSSVLDTEGTSRINPVYIYNEDGTEAEFSPLFASETGDSLLRFGPLTGISYYDGKIYLSSHGFRMTANTEGALVGNVWNQLRSFIHVIDAETGETVDVGDVSILRIETSTHAPNRAGITEDGFVILSFVFNNSPIVVIDPNDNWNIINTITDAKQGFSRSFEVSLDGTRIYNPQNESDVEDGIAGSINVYEAPSVFDEYERVESLAIGAKPGAIARYPNSDIIFFSGGGVDSVNPDADEPWVSSRFYGVSTTSGNVVDEFGWFFNEGDAYRVPRGLAISPDGLTAYVGSFYPAGALNIQKFTRSEPVSIERGGEIANGFTLEQNYPNPFNPTTTISYTLGDAGMTTIRVYDMIGRVVATLVNQEMPAGTHNVNFNAANLGSGIYLYELTSGNVRLTNKMTLVK